VAIEGRAVGQREEQPVLIYRHWYALACHFGVEAAA